VVEWAALEMRYRGNLIRGSNPLASAKKCIFMNMFKKTPAKTVAEYLKLQPEPVRGDLVKIHKLVLKYAPKLKPKMWGSFIGYGTYKQKYASGKEVEWMPVALSAWKSYISFYACLTVDGKYIAEKYKKELPKASIGKSCIRFKSLDHVDEKVLIKIIKDSAKAAKN